MSEPGCMDGADRNELRAEFVGGPIDGARGMVCVGLERVLQVTGGVVHIYEFDPVTTEDGEAWLYRYAGAQAWVKGGPA